MKIFELLALGTVFADDLEPCEEGLVDLGNDICADPEVAPQIQEIITDIEAEEAVANQANGIQARRFQLGQPSNDVGLDSIDTLRTKRRSQRMTLVVTKVMNNDAFSGLKPKQFLKRLNNYGCHCWTKPNTEDVGYKGKPLDGLDRACRTLHSCHTCIGIDFPGEEPKTCDPITTRYKAKLVKADNGDLEIRCTNTMNPKGTNNGDCKRSLCECDKEFANQASMMWQEWDERHWQLDNQGLFEKACVPGGGSGAIGSGSRMMGGGKPDQCCGFAYPGMKPFNSESHECTKDKKILPKNNI